MSTLPPPAAANLGLGECVEVVGEQYYVDALRALKRNADRLAVVAVLKLEPHNKYDRNAVGVYLSERQVGHLSRDDAVWLRPLIDAAIAHYGEARVLAEICGGGSPSVSLETQSANAMSRHAIVRVIRDAGFCAAERDLHRAGYGVRVDPDAVRVFWLVGDGADREERVPQMAKVLRDAGYHARVVREQGYPLVRVAGHGTSA